MRTATLTLSLLLAASTATATPRAFLVTVSNPADEALLDQPVVEAIGQLSEEVEALELWIPVSEISRVREIADQVREETGDLPLTIVTYATDGDEEKEEETPKDPRFQWTMGKKAPKDWSIHVAIAPQATFRFGYGDHLRPDLEKASVFYFRPLGLELRSGPLTLGSTLELPGKAFANKGGKVVPEIYIDAEFLQTRDGKNFLGAEGYWVNNTYRTEFPPAFGEGNLWEAEKASGFGLLLTYRRSIPLDKNGKFNLSLRVGAGAEITGRTYSFSTPTGDPIEIKGENSKVTPVLKITAPISYRVKNLAPPEEPVVVTPQTLNKPTGSVDDQNIVRLTTDVPDAVIRYTKDGTEPTDDSPVYDPATGIPVVGKGTVKARAYKEGMTASEVTEVPYDAPLPKVEPATASHASGTYTESFEVTLSTNTPDAKIYYTTDGTKPTEDSTPYDGPIAITEDAKLRALAFKEGMELSELLERDYVVVKKDFYEPHVLEGVTFPVNSAALDNNALQILKNQARVLKEDMERLPDLNWEIGGFTDITGNDVKNQTLSENRAKAVRDALSNFDLDGDGNPDLDGDRLIAVGYGETKPLGNKNDPKDQARSRRIELKPIQVTDQ